MSVRPFRCDKSAPSVSAKGAVLNAVCVAVIVLAAGISLACAVFGICTLSFGYPTFGDEGYCHVGEEGVPDYVDGEALIIFSPCEGSVAEKGDMVVFGGRHGARVGACELNDAKAGRLVVRTAYGMTSVAYSAVTGKVVGKDVAAGKFVGALARAYPASAITLYVFAAGIIAMAVVLSVKRKRGGPGAPPAVAAHSKVVSDPDGNDLNLGETDLPSDEDNANISDGDGR